MRNGNRPTPEFRREAVRLALTGGRTRREIAENLGIGLSTLTRWRRQERDAGEPHVAPVDVHAELKRDLAVEVLRRALVARNPAPGLVHHSDRGSQTLLYRLSGPASQTCYPDLDERARELLQQRDGRDLLQDHQDGADLAGRLAIPPAGRKRRRQIHRRPLITPSGGIHRLASRAPSHSSGRPRK